MAALFDGSPKGFAIFSAKHSPKIGKVVGDFTPKFGGVPTREDWLAHLRGELGKHLAISPTRKNETCVFSAIDVDYPVSALKGKLGQPLLPCRSKSGNCHLFSFHQPTSTTIAYSRMYCAMVDLGIDGSRCGLYPSKVWTSNVQGNGPVILMPYFGESPEPLSLDEFVASAEEHAEQDFSGPVDFNYSLGTRGAANA
jgi:hypothetical protein